MKKIFVRILRYQKPLFLLLLIIAAGAIFLPIHNFQTPIAQGDHGRDLYAFQQVSEGAVPYHDFWWVYGPLTPYLFALIFKIFGASIQAAIATQLAFKVCTAIFFYLALICFASPIFAFAGALWFLKFQPIFPHTYTHSLGITTSVAMIYFLFCYLQFFQKKYLFFGLVAGFFLFFMKINFGMVNLAAFSSSFLILNYVFKETRAHQKTYFLTLFSALFLVVAIHWIILRGLPFYAVRQCFPLLNTDHPYTASVLTTFYAFVKNSLSVVSKTWIKLFFSSLVCFSFANILLQSPTTKKEKEQKLKTLIALSFLGIFFIFNLHEFLVSGVHYRLIWAKPFQIMLLFLVLAAGQKNLNKLIKSAFLLVIFSLITINLITQNNIVRYVKQPAYRFKINKTDIFTTNPPEWTSTIRQTTYFLNAQLKNSETFFALPYDPIYYFLTNKKSPTRQLIFFDHINIPKEQEIKIIAELNNKAVNYVVLSNRCDSKEHGLGTFGKTYCPLLASYIFSNFEPIRTFGDWTNEPGWAWNHGTKIFRRK
ncbi:MAG: hypothetical protein P9M07_08780 [Candidatus Aceula meridiana]|nr:hypothetical protein [Candidatus Aceula meridiana]